MKSITIENSDASSSLQIHSNTSDIGYVIQSIEGLEYPSTRISVINRGGEHGTFFASSFYGERRVTLEGRLYADSSVTNETRRRNLESILDIERDANGVPAHKNLKFTTLDDLQLQISCIVAAPLKMPVGRPRDSAFQIDLVAYYAIQSQTQHSESFTSPSGGGFILPVVLPVTFTASSGSNKTITNAGTTDANPAIVFTGPLTNPALSNVTLGKSIALTRTLNSGDIVTLDMREKAALLNGTTNIIGDITSASQWWWLSPGNNDIQFSTSNSADTGSATLIWRDAYLGV
jgi:hypothetical protein